VYAWGGNIHGELGLGHNDRVSVNKPTLVVFPGDIRLDNSITQLKNPEREIKPRTIEYDPCLFAESEGSDEEPVSDEASKKCFIC